MASPTRTVVSYQPLFQGIWRSDRGAAMRNGRLSLIPIESQRVQRGCASRFGTIGPDRDTTCELLHGGLTGRGKALELFLEVPIETVVHSAPAHDNKRRVGTSGGARMKNRRVRKTATGWIHQVDAEHVSSGRH